MNHKRKGQLKIQEMAFVLIAILVFFSLAALIYFTIITRNLKSNAQEIKDTQAQDLVKKLSSFPELSWSKDCASCIDQDKALVLKDRKSYSNFWNIDYLAIKQIYPLQTGGECNKGNYPNCNVTTIINNPEGALGKTNFAFVALCGWNGENQRDECKLGMIVASGKGIE